MYIPNDNTQNNTLGNTPGIRQWPLNWSNDNTQITPFLLIIITDSYVSTLNLRNKPIKINKPTNEKMKMNSYKTLGTSVINTLVPNAHSLPEETFRNEGISRNNIIYFYE